MLTDDTVITITPGRGPIFTQGAGVPTATTPWGTYLDTSTGNLYHSATGAWSLACTLALGGGGGQVYGSHQLDDPSLIDHTRNATYGDEFTGPLGAYGDLNGGVEIATFAGGLMLSAPNGTGDVNFKALVLNISAIPAGNWLAVLGHVNLTPLGVNNFGPAWASLGLADGLSGHIAKVSLLKTGGSAPQTWNVDSLLLGSPTGPITGTPGGGSNFTSPAVALGVTYNATTGYYNFVVNVTGDVNGWLPMGGGLLASLSLSGAHFLVIGIDSRDMAVRALMGVRWLRWLQPAALGGLAALMWP